jgi:hypothetical protein
MIAVEQAFAARPRVVIVNGPAGVGKTSTAQALAAMGRSGACVHGDDLKRFVVRRDTRVATGLGYRNGATVAGNFIEGGYDLVVFDFVFEDPDGVGVFLDAYTASAPVHLFTLWADLPTVVAREARATTHGRRLATVCPLVMPQWSAISTSSAKFSIQVIVTSGRSPRTSACAPVRGWDSSSAHRTVFDPLGAWTVRSTPGGLV